MHDQIYDLLRTFGADCTHDQDSFTKDKIPKGPYYCYDMKNCTDRLPIELQVMIVAELTSVSKAQAWKYLLSAQPFHVPIANLQGVKEVTYTVGQPMGAYSSWAVMALTHHFIV